MRLIGDKLRALARLFTRAWRRVARVVPDMPGAPEGLADRAKYRVGFYRTLAAPRWRVAVRWSIVAFGFAFYFFLQLLLAFMIHRLDVDPDAWAFITAFYIAAICIIVAAAKPTFAFIAWLVISPLGFLFLRMDFGASLPAITFDRVVLVAMAGLLLARALVHRRRMRKPLAGESLILAFIGYTVLMVFILHPGDLAATLQIVSERFDHIALAVFVYYIAKSVLVTRQHVKWAVIGLVLTGVYVAGFAFYEHYTGSMWFSSFLGREFRLRVEDVGMGRACGPLINPGVTGTFLGITAFLTLHLTASVRSRFGKVVCFALVWFQLVACYFTFTRSGFLAPILLLLIMPFAAKRYRRQYAAFLVAAIVVVIVALPIAFSSADVARRFTQEKTILTRAVVTAGTINIIKHHPLFGVGLGEINAALDQYITNVGELSGLYARGLYPGRTFAQRRLIPAGTSHNSILTIFAEQGIVGGLLFSGALIALLVHLIKVRARMPSGGVIGKDLVSLIILAVIGHISSTLFYDIRFFKYPSYFLWLLLALGVRLGQIEAEQQEAEEIEPASSPESVGGLVHA